jgi:SWI/SNF-related matrix-associated actin-dependent regulator of chromatin subfamily A3
MEPQWNPTLESQAIGRVLRIGQQKQVTVVRYCVKNTVEEARELGDAGHDLKADCLQNIQRRQKYKLQLAKLGFGDNPSGSTEEKLEKLNVSIDISIPIDQRLELKTNGAYRNFES